MFPPPRAVPDPQAAATGRRRSRTAGTRQSTRRRDDLSALSDKLDSALALHRSTELTEVITRVLVVLTLRWEQGRLADGLGPGLDPSVLGWWTLLAHAVADLGLAHLAPPLVEVLAPHRGGWSTVRNTGGFGPVGLAETRLRVLLGQRAEAADALAAALTG